jgi:class 3 adenylate cyclase/tetratricopeptide (TPR) repeat protein
VGIFALLQIAYRRERAILKSVFYPGEDVRLVESSGNIFSGALLVADIAGFTEMTEILSRGGAEGMEELTSVLDSVFHLMTEEVFRNDGSVISFSGDSVLARFSSPAGAAACAEAMMTGIREFRRVVLLGRRFSLRAKIVIGSGMWCQFIAGDRKGAHLIAAGALASELGERESLAQEGEIITFEGREITGSCDAPCPETEPASFISKGCERAHGEHRAVTSLFAHMTLDMGSSSAAVRLQGLYLLLRNTAEAHGGFLHHVDTTGGGFVRFFMLFGAPVSTGNDTMNGLCAALALRSLLKDDAGIRIRLGIDTGYVYAGTIGGRNRRQYTVIGDPVNTAARLADKAPPFEILASAAVMRRTCGEVLYRGPQQVTVRGKSSPVDCYGPAERVGPAAGPASLLERPGELSRLNAALASRLRTVLVCGEPGIGKTSLLAMLREQLSKQGTRVMNCSTAGKGGNWGIFRGILHDLCEAGPETTGPELEKALDELLGRSLNRELTMRRSFLGRMLLDLNIKDPVFDSLPPKLRMENLQDAVSMLILAIPGQAAVMVEDVHQADEDEMSALAAVIGRVNGEDPEKAFILTARTAGASRVAEAIRCERLELAGLSPSESESLLLNELDNCPLDEEILRLLKKKASGNPFYLVQFSSFLRENNLITLDNGIWRKTAEKSLENLPESVFSMIMARIDTLSEITRESLKSASVIGFRFAGPVLENLLGRSVHTDLTETHRAGLTRSLSVPLEHVFSHMLIREVAYDSILPERRQALHRDIGLILEKRHQNSPGDFAPLLARHFRKGKCWEKALEYSVKAALRADDEYRNAEALYHCGRAIRIIEKHLPDSRSELVLCLHRSAMINDRIGEYDRAIELYRSVAGMSCDTEIVSGALLSMADIFFNRGDIDESLELAEEVAQLSRQCDEPPAGIELRVSSFRAWCHCVRGEVDDAEREALRAVSMGDKLMGLTEKERAAGVGHALNTLATVHWVKSDYSRAGALYREAIELARKNGMIREEAVSWGNTGLVLEKQGRYREAIAGVQKQLSIASRIGEKLLVISAHGSLSMVYALLGDYRLALEHASQQRRLAETLQVLHDNLLAHNHLATISIALGELDDAEEFIERAMEVEKANPMERERAHSLYALGMLKMARGRRSEALRCFEEAILIADRIQSASFLQKLLVHKAQILAATDRIEEAEVLLRQADAIAGSADMIHERACCRSAAGYLLGKKGMYSDAISEFKTAEKAFGAIEALPGMAETCLRAALVLSAAEGGYSSLAEEYRHKAREMYSRMDIPIPVLE